MLNGYELLRTMYWLVLLYCRVHVFTFTLRNDERNDTFTRQITTTTSTTTTTAGGYQGSVLDIRYLC